MLVAPIGRWHCDSARTITCWRSWNRSDYEGGAFGCAPILLAAHVAQ